MKLKTAVALFDRMPFIRPQRIAWETIREYLAPSYECKGCAYFIEETNVYSSRCYECKRFYHDEYTERGTEED